MKSALTVKAKYLVLISLTLTLILFIITVLDITEGNKDISLAKRDEAFSLLGAVKKSAENVYISSSEVENQIKEKLINAAYFIADIDKSISLNNTRLQRIADDIGIEHISLFNSEGKRKISNDNVEFNIRSQFAGEIDSINAGLYDYFFPGIIYDKDGAEHFSVIQKRYPPRDGFMVISLSSEKLLDFRKRIGVGSLFQNIASTADIVYVVMQDEKGIITASRGVDELSSIDSDTFLASSLKENKFITREASFKDKKVFEAVMPFNFNDNNTGIIRIGLSLDQADKLLNRTVLRSIVISSFLLLTGIILIIVITDKQNLALIREENKKIQTYTGNILNNMSEGVMAADAEGKINLINPAAEKIMGFEPGAAIGMYCRDIIKESECLIEKAIRINDAVDYLEVKIFTKNGNKIIIGGSADIVRNNDYSINTVVAVFRDITEQRSMEEAQKRNEKLSAMGELAAGVAHEIKNPLNAIGITSQRLAKEFTPVDGEDEYREMIKTIKSEVERVSSIINQFLTYARPQKVILKQTDAAALISDVYNIFYSRSIKDNIRFTAEPAKAFILADYSMLKQALINIVQNAFEAVSSSGSIIITSSVENRSLLICISDDGPGIPDKNKTRIFNLYFTTKVSGSGLGLSIVNQVIADHNGTITIDSVPGKGTKFNINIPLWKD